MSLRVLFVPVGSEGDVNPLLWLAGGLAARGHKPLVLITPHYGRLAEKASLPWLPVGTEEDFLNFSRDPKVWNHRVGPITVMKGVAKTMPRGLAALRELGTDFDLVVTSSLGQVATSWAEAQGVPSLLLHMQPLILRSEEDFPLYSEDLNWMRKAPRWVQRAFLGIVDKVMWGILGKAVNDLRADLGLKPLKNFYDALNRAGAIAAMFPDWYAPPRADWPPHLRQFGFPLHKEAKPLPPDLESYLTAGSAPIVWTHGSANFDIRRFHARALAISRELGVRCLLISLEPPQEALQEGAYHVSHARFEDVFPRCAAVVHHGGIGTTAKAIAAGVPQVIIPRSHDQPDNASRIVHLGLGATVSYQRLESPALPRILKDLLSSDSVKKRCKEYQQRLLTADPLPAICDWVEELAASPKKPI